MSSHIKQPEEEHKMDSHEVYKAAAQGDIGFLENYKSEISSFVSPAKNTILHIYIIAQPIKKKEATTVPEKLLSSLKAVPTKFKQTFCAEQSTETALSAAETVQAMLNMCPSLLSKVNEAGDTPLHVAARHGHDDIAKVLIARAKSSNNYAAAEEDVERGSGGDMAVYKMFHEINENKETALHQAVRYQHGNVVEVLVAEDDPTFSYYANEEGETPLYMAVERRNYDLVKMIVDGYAAPAYGGPDGRTVLHAAAIHNFYGDDIFEKKWLKLLSRKVDNRGRTPFHYNPYMLIYDRAAAFMVDNDGKTGLHIVASSNHSWWNIIWLIEECPECFEVVDAQGRNVLHLAAESGNEEVINLILQNELFSDLLKKKDKNGNTPLHLLVASRHYLPEAIKDHRWDKMAFNKEMLNPMDIISRNSLLSKNEKRVKDCMLDTEIYQGGRVWMESDGKNIAELGNTKGGKRDSHGDVNANIEKCEDDRKEARQNHLVVAALIATVTFAAGFTMPGGYIQDKGYAVLAESHAFIAFVITDTLAMVFSCAAVFIHLLMAMDKDKEKQKVSELFNKALPLTLLAIVAMIIAFITGTYAVLAHSQTLAISAAVIGSLFFYLFGYLAEKVYSTRFRIFQWVLHRLIDMVSVLLFALPYFISRAIEKVSEWFPKDKSYRNLRSTNFDR